MQISAKNLGELRSPSFCERCFWIKTHKKLPYQIFPSIFNSIDAYTKTIVEGYVGREGKLPAWLSEIGDVSRVFNNASSAMNAKGLPKSKFNVQYKEVLLTGNPDAIYQRPNGDIVIVDYKTARYTKGQDNMMPIYEIQVNGYAYIAEKLGIAPIESLYLIYFEPPEGERRESLSKKHTTVEGFEMPFKASVHRIKKNTEQLEALMDEAYRIYSMDKPPVGIYSCENCVRIADLMGL